MDKRSKLRLWRSLVIVFGSLLIVAGAGMAFARTFSGPPFEQQATDCTATTPDCQQQVDPVQERQRVEDFFSTVQNDCGTAFLGQADLGDQQTTDAFGALVDGLESGQTSHMVQSVRVLLQNCADHPNDGLMNALYHHGLNWQRHYEHELWLEQKFADKWPDGKPGKPDRAEKLHGNPHDVEGATTGGRGHGNGHIEGS
jgi:hypothetical protein